MAVLKEEYPGDPKVDALAKEFAVRRELQNLDRTSGDLQKQIDDTKRKMVLDPNNPTHKAKLRVLLQKQKYELGVALATKGDDIGAATALEDALVFGPMPEAADLLAKIKGRASMAALELKGDTLRRNGDVKGAIVAYTQYLTQDPTNDRVRGKLARAQIGVHLTKAAALRQKALAAQDDPVKANVFLVEAIAELDKVLAIDPQHVEALPLKRDLGNQQKFNELWARGNALDKATKYSNAKKVFKDAMNHAKAVGGVPARLVATVTKRHKDSNFNQLIVQTEAAIATKEWLKAWGYVKVAKGSRPADPKVILLERIIKPNVDPKFR